MKYLSLSILALCITQATSVAATYVAPKSEDRILIEVDKIPLDTDTIKWVGSYLSNLAEQQVGGTALELRSSAKLIAIAQQLDPSNNRFKEANSALVSAQKPAPLDPTKSEQHQRRLWTIINFLASSEGSDQGRVLAALTMDALVGIAPKNPALKDFRAPSDQWHSTIAKLEKFKFEPEPELVSNERISHSDLPSIDPTTIEEESNFEEKPEQAKWHTRQLSIVAPFTTYYLDSDNRTRHELAINQLKISINSSSLESGKSIQISSKPTIHNQDRLSHLTHSIERVLKTQWKSIEPAKISIRCDSAYSYSNDHNIVTAALVVALDSSLAEKSLRKNLVVAAPMDNKEKFTDSTRYWATFNNLVTNCESSRVLVSPETVGYFKQLIALEKIDFFVKNEVITVTDLLQARAYSSKVESTEIANSSALFEELKTALDNKSLRSMTQNKFVRQKLEQILKSTPNHLSAKMLLAYGEVKIMPSLDSKYLGLELSNIISKSKQFVDTRNNYISSNMTLNESENIDQRIDKIKKYASKKDQPLLDQVSLFADQLKTHSKAQENALNKSSNYYRKAVTTSLRELRSNYHDIQIKLAALTGIPYKVDK